MKYVALLRAINVGGNSIIKMQDLKKAFEEAGYTNVITYIQSGNVVFESDQTNVQHIATHLEELLSKAFHYTSKVVIRSQKELQKIIADIPKSWKDGSDIRCYIAFVREPVTEKEVEKEIEIHEGIDFVETAKGVVYMSTKMEGLTKSRFTKFIGKKTYKEVTMRNLRTSQKILEIMEKK
jgi:uncharacterized protein (DUF1697 family)